MIILGALILALIILITGIVMLLLSRRFLPRGRTARNVLAVISGCFVLAGIVLSIGPISVLVQSAYYRATPPEGFVETGVSVENWDNGRFTADGVEYQLVDLEFNVLLAENFTGEAAFTYDEPGRANDSRNLNFYPVENESGFALYWPSRYLNLYCPADQVEQVLDYYQSDASGRAYFLKDNGLHPVDDKTAAALEPLLTEDLNGSVVTYPCGEAPQMDGFDLLRTSGDGIFVLEEYIFLKDENTVWYVIEYYYDDAVERYTVAELPQALSEALLYLCNS